MALVSLNLLNLVQNFIIVSPAYSLIDNGILIVLFRPLVFLLVP